MSPRASAISDGCNHSVTAVKPQVLDRSITLSEGHRSTVRKPFSRRPHRRFYFGLFEKIPVVFDMSSSEVFELATFHELLERVGTRRLKQPVAHHRVAEIRCD